MKLLHRFIAVSVLIGASSAAMAGTVRVPLCLQFPDDDRQVPCTGVIPVDVSGNPLDWETILSGGGGSGSAYTGPVAAQLPVTLGAKTKATSLSVVAASDGFSIANTSFAATQSGTWTVGLSTGANVIGSISNTGFAATQSGAWNIANVTGTVSLPTGASTAANQATGNTALVTIATNTAGLATSANQIAQTTALNALAAPTKFAAITPSDDIALATIPRAIYVGGSGNLTVKGSDNVLATFSVTAGQILHISPTFVMATDTSAGGLVALF